ncbi:subclass B1 metallo-beta-lactamase [Larkinella soli]|uniref:subclass B1 metallo-beta-lactamase n=1 Tax=Larkinella soli TaxID=1770527 RepID=UPI000FFBA27B|nr:subclass B1 metallo-beta-lactamase [Larkinella soli]
MSKLLRTRLLTFAILFLIRGPVWAQADKKPMLEVTPLNDRVYVHVSYGEYNNAFIPSNGLIIDTGDGVVLVDTAWDSDSTADNTRRLLRWVADNLRRPVRLCIVTHAHDDRVGGIRALREAGVRVVSTPLTARKSVERGYPSPEAVLPADTTFRMGRESIRCYFPGEGHTSDNIVVWLPNHRILHGGCLVKSVAAFGMGNVAEANLKEWAGSIRNVIDRFGTAKVVVPGHQEWGDAKALEHTIHMLTKFAAGRR